MVRCTYRLVRALIARGFSGVLDNEIDHLGIVEKGRHKVGDQPYKKALLIIMFGSMLPRSQQLTRNRRMELGNALAYAAAHRINWKLVNGFIKQAGLKASGAKLAANHREPGFE
jgi:hypothetical protein